MTFLDKFDKDYAPKLAARTKTFRRIFDELEKKNKGFYLIVETGCARTINGYVGDGMSTVLFDDFVNFHNGAVHSVDINKDHCSLANSLTSNRTEVINSDSVQFLTRFEWANKIDLLYLDSFDIDFNDPHASAQHHMKEFKAIIDRLEKGTIIAVDDHRSDKSGKGMYIAEYMKNKGYERFIDDYQIGWIL